MNPENLIELYQTLPDGMRAIVAISLGVICYIGLRLFIRSANKSAPIPKKNVSYIERLKAQS